MNKKFLALLLACALLTALLCGCTQVTGDRTLDDFSAVTATPQTDTAQVEAPAESADPAAEPQPTEEVVNDPDNVGYNG